MIRKPCDHCGQDLALYWVPLMGGRVRFAVCGEVYPLGIGVMVWARTVDDAHAAVLGAIRDTQHAVTVCPRSEFEDLQCAPTVTAEVFGPEGGRA